MTAPNPVADVVRPAPAEAGTGRNQGVRPTTTRTGTSEVYPTDRAEWMSWAEVEVTGNPEIGGALCDWCDGDGLGAEGTVRVHNTVTGFKDVCEQCAPEVVQTAVDLNPDNHLTQVEVNA